MVRIAIRSISVLVVMAALAAAACTPAPPAAEPPPQPPAAPKPADPAQPAAKPAAKPAEQPAPKPAEQPVAKPAVNFEGFPQDPQAQRGGTLQFGNHRDLITTNPFVNTQSVGQYIKETIWEPLITIDRQGRLHPALADRWEVSDDVTEFTFYLRQGAKFHDGQEMTADDVIWSINHVLDPENGAIGHPRLAMIDRVDKIDDYAIRVVTREPGVTFLAHLAEIRALPVVPEGSMQTGQLDVGQNPPPGTGPFKFVEYVPNTRTVVERFDDYWGGAAYLDRIVFNLIPDDTVRFTALRAGDIHVAARLPVEWLPRLSAGEVQGINTHDTPDAGWRRLIINQTSPLMSNKLLRQALAYALDRDAILEEAYFGFGTPMNARVPVGSIWHTVAPEARPRDLDRSRELQQQAGYQGEEIFMMSLRGHEAYAEPIHRMLTEAGFNVRLEFLESAARQDRTARGQFDLNTGGGGVHPDPAVSVRANYFCEPDVELRIDNDTGYCNPEVDRILDELDQTADEAERLELFKQFVEITFDDVVNYSIGAQPQPFGSTDRLQNWAATPAGGYTDPDTGGLARAWLRP